MATPTTGIAAQATVTFLRASTQLPERIMRDPVCRDYLWRQSVALAASGASERLLQVRRTLSGGIR